MSSLGAWPPTRPPPQDPDLDVAIRKYAKLVGSAAEGAVTS